jgi:hypothetical protein
MKINMDYFFCSLKLVNNIDEIREIDDCLLRSQEARVDA